MTADPHTETNADLLKRLYAALKHNKSCSCGECCGGLNAADALAARLEAAERDRDRQQERVDYLFRTHPSEWEPEVIRWLSPAVRAGWEGSAVEGTAATPGEDEPRCEKCGVRDGTVDYRGDGLDGAPMWRCWPCAPKPAETPTDAEEKTDA